MVEFTLQRKRPIVWDPKVAVWEYPTELRYHALSSRYIVETPDRGEFGSYRTIAEALAAIGNTKTYWLPLKTPLADSKRGYVLAMRTRLDLTSLPPPLRLLAYVSPSWRLGSRWSQWDIDR